VNALVKERHPINKTTQTVVLRANEATSMVRIFYSDIAFVGKYYSIRNLNKKGVLWYYNICNCIKPEVYNE